LWDQGRALPESHRDFDQPFKALIYEKDRKSEGKREDSAGGPAHGANAVLMTAGGVTVGIVRGPARIGLAFSVFDRNAAPLQEAPH
jgi:hypothetical protein